MRLSLVVAILAISVFSNIARADGKFKFIAQNSSVFIKIEFIEKDGVVTGKLSSTGGYAELGLQTSPTQVIATMGPETFVFDAVSAPTPTQTILRGRGLDNRLIENKCFTNAKKQYKTMTGWAELNSSRVNYQVSLDAKKKNFYLEFEKMIFQYSGVKGKPGKGRGEIRYDMQKTGDIVVDSSGTLEDLFTKDCNHVLAWVVNMFVYPEKTSSTQNIRFNL